VPAVTSRDVDALVIGGRFGDPARALAALDELMPGLELAADGEAVLVALYGRALLLRRTGAPVEESAEACDVLERAAQERRSPVWAAAACAFRARTRLDAGSVSAAMADLARVDVEQLEIELPGRAGHLLLDVLAGAYMRLRLSDRVDDVRRRLDEAADLLTPLDRATHWAHWSAELAGRAMEPVAAGREDPDWRMMDRAVAVAARLAELPDGDLPRSLRRTGTGVRALAAAYQGRANEALRLLGADAFGEPDDLPPLERQVVTLAAIHAHTLLGSLATARSLDDGAQPPPAALPHLVLEVCRARERLWLETHAGGDLVPVLRRLTELLVRLGWQSMDLVAETARQSLEHHALKTESRTDPLTGVGNRRALDEELRHMLRFTPLPMALVLVDVDDFKKVNDDFTHVVGDEVLRRVASSLAQQLRIGDRLVRYGGDEFVALLPRTGDQEARNVAARMRQAIGKLPWSELAGGLTVGITTGTAALWSLSGRRPDRDAESLFRRADERLLEAKRNRGASGAQSQRAGRADRAGDALVAPIAAAPIATAPIATAPVTAAPPTATPVPRAPFTPPAVPFTAPQHGRRAAGPPDDAPDGVLAPPPAAAPVSSAPVTPAPMPWAAPPRPVDPMADTQPGLLGSLDLPPAPSPDPTAGERLPWAVAPEPLPRAGGHRAEGWGERNDPGARWYGVAPPPAGSPVPGAPVAPAIPLPPAPPPLPRSADGAPALDPSATPPTGSVSLHRPRHRPPVIDLTRTDSPHRSPFG